MLRLTNFWFGLSPCSRPTTSSTHSTPPPHPTAIATDPTASRTPRTTRCNSEVEKGLSLSNQTTVPYPTLPRFTQNQHTPSTDEHTHQQTEGVRNLHWWKQVVGRWKHCRPIRTPLGTLNDMVMFLRKPDVQICVPKNLNTAFYGGSCFEIVSKGKHPPKYELFRASNPSGFGENAFFLTQPPREKTVSLCCFDVWKERETKGPLGFAVIL